MQLAVAITRLARVIIAVFQHYFRSFYRFTRSFRTGSFVSAVQLFGGGRTLMRNVSCKVPALAGPHKTLTLNAFFSFRDFQRNLIHKEHVEAF